MIAPLSMLWTTCFRMLNTPLSLTDDSRLPSIADGRILIAEDEAVSRMTLQTILTKAGFTQLEMVENGQQALDALLHFQPDVIITDINMPALNGLDLCRALRASDDDDLASLPILVQSALTESAEKEAIFAAGATDYVCKPIDPPELVARVKVHVEHEHLTRALRQFKTRVSQELATAASTQRIMLPNAHYKETLETAYHLHIDDHFQPSSELGGDMWGSHMISEDEIGLYNVDFSGHGVNAALNTIRLNAFMKSAGSVARSPSAYLSHLNALIKPLLPTEHYATMLYGVVNIKTHQFSYASAGAPAPVLFRQSGEVEMLSAVGMLLGVVDNVSYETVVRPFHPGDCLLIYSDALIETPGDDGHFWPIEEVAVQFQSQMGSSLHHTYEAAFAAIIQHFNAQYMPHLCDDLTLIACSRLG